METIQAFRFPEKLRITNIDASDFELSELEISDFETHAQERVIEDITNGIIDIHNLMVDIRSLVHDQGDHIDSIVDHIQHTREHIDAGNRELEVTESTMTYIPSPWYSFSNILRLLRNLRI